MKINIFSVIALALILSGYVKANHLERTNKNTKNNNDSDTTTVRVIVDNNKSASFYFSDEFNDIDPPFFLTNNDQLKKIYLKHPTLLIDSYHQIPFLIYPGEALTLKVSNDGIPEFRSGGSNLRNNELQFFISYYKQFNTGGSSGLFMRKNTFLLYNKNSFDKVILKAKSDSTNRFLFLKSYNEKHKVSPSFYSYVNTLFKNLYIVDVLKPLSYINFDPNNLPASYSTYVNSMKCKFDCDSCLGNEAYRKSVISMSKFISRNFVNSPLKFSRNYDATSHFFTGLTRRFVLFVMLKNNSATNPQYYNNRVTEYKNEAKDIYSNYLTTQSRLSEKYKIDASDKKEIINSNGDKYTWDELMNKYHGYTIYLDFWASWCIPCRKNLPFSQKLEESLKDKKIVFLYLSIDDSADKWEKAMSNEHIDRSSSYFVLNQKFSSIKRRFNLNLIPRYVIISKNGYTIDDNAPFPNNILLKTKLIDYLSN